jgi:tetratricopeptide (TPR) repeat protein
MNRKNLIAIAVAAVVVVALIIGVPRLTAGSSEVVTPDTVASNQGQQAPPISEGAELPADHPDINADQGEGQEQANTGNAEALAAAEKEYEEKPTDLSVLLKLGNAYLTAQRNDDAERIFKEALVVDANSGAAKAGLGMVKFAKGDAAGAQADLERVTKEDPQNQDAFYNLAVVYFSAGERDKAKEAWEACAAIDETTDLGKLAGEFLQLMSSGDSSAENPHGGGAPSGATATTAG